VSLEREQVPEFRETSLEEHRSKDKYQSQGRETRCQDEWIRWAYYRPIETWLAQ
jgi:hypothetical protein